MNNSQCNFTNMQAHFTQVVYSICSSHSYMCVCWKAWGYICSYSASQPVVKSANFYLRTESTLNTFKIYCIMRGLSHSPFQIRRRENSWTTSHALVTHVGTRTQRKYIVGREIGKGEEVVMRTTDYSVLLTNFPPHVEMLSSGSQKITLNHQS